MYSRLSLYAFLLLGAGYIMLNNGLPLKRSATTKTATCGAITFNQYILIAYRALIDARGSSNCTQWLEQNPGQNQYYCQCNSITGSPNTLDTTTSQEVSSDDDSSIQSNSTTTNATETTLTNETTKELTEELKGCWMTFLTDVEEGSKRVLGGDYSLYKIPRQGPKETLWVRLFDKEQKFISEKEVSTDADGEWVSLNIDSYAVTIPYGDNTERVLVTVKDVDDEYLTCDEIRKYFIMTCTESFVIPASSSLPRHYSLIPMATLFTVKSSSIVLDRLKGRKRREEERAAVEEECKLVENRVPLADISPLPEGHILVGEDETVDIGKCVRQSGICKPKAYKSHHYISQDVSSGRYTIHDVPQIIATAC